MCECLSPRMNISNNFLFSKQSQTLDVREEDENGRTHRNSTSQPYRQSCSRRPNRTRPRNSRHRHMLPSMLAQDVWRAYDTLH